MPAANLSNPPASPTPPEGKPPFLKLLMVLGLIVVVAIIALFIGRGNGVSLSGGSLVNPFDKISNPFAKQEENPFAESQDFNNPFSAGETTSDQPYQNPFEKLR